MAAREDYAMPDPCSPDTERSSLLSRSYPAHDEENRPDRDRDQSPASTAVSDHGLGLGQWTTMLVLLVGVLVVNSDSAILMTLFRHVASEFSRLSSSSWILTSYIIGIISTQPLYGKLSDIYGRKPLLLIAYCFYFIGSIIGGTSLSFWSLLLGRFLCGIGNAGITVLISTIIVDLVPIREVAVWRSYVYAVNHVGRSAGPPIGGFIADSINWRWSVALPAPFILLGMFYICRRLSLPSPPSFKTVDASIESGWSKLRRIDFLGSVSLALANISLLVFLDQIQKSSDSFSYNPPTLFALSSCIAFVLIFIGVEAYWAREPILPLRLLAKRNVISAYGIQLFQTASQMAFYTSVPLYFRVTNADSSTTVAFRLSCITLGSVTGGLISGYMIKRTGLYRLAITIANTLTIASFSIIFLRWRGQIGWPETVILCFPVGIGFGVSLSAAFIGLAAGLDPSQVAVSTSGFYLSLNIGSLTGVTSASVLISVFVQRELSRRLGDLPNAGQIIRDVMSSFDSINDLPREVGQVVLGAYTQSFKGVWFTCLIFGCLSLVAGMVMREGQLEESTPPRPPTTVRTQNYNTFASPNKPVDE